LSIPVLILSSFAVVKFMMIFMSLEIPLWCMNKIKETESDKERMFLAKMGMFFDCPVCTSMFSAVIVFVLDIVGLGFVNLILGLSVIGVIINKRLIKDSRN